MSREIFLNALRVALQGYISQGKVNEHLNYYENYIIEESRKGRTEEEVLECLGDPRLIAKTIIETEKNAQDHIFQDEQNTSKGKQLRKTLIPIKLGAKGWILLALAIVGIILVLTVKILVFVLPILLPVAVIATVIHLFHLKNKKS